MKKLILSAFLIISSCFGILSMGILFTGCDAGFDDMNVDDTAINALEPMTILNDVIQLTPNAGAYGYFIYDSAIIQQNIAPFGQTFAGGNLNQDNQAAWVVNYFDQEYDRFHNATDVMLNTEGSDFFHNAHQKARIWRAYIGLRATDSMGDVPFSEAGLAYREQILNPGYDSQESIYETALEEILQATNALDANERIETTDILYAGDIVKWKQLGYSLLLRYGMRVSEVAPNMAQQYVTAAYEGGVFRSNDDNARIIRDDNYNFSLSDTFNGGERHAFYLTDVFVNHLRDTNDPRLSSIAVRYVDAGGIGDQDARLNRTTDPVEQVGMPLGHDQSTIAAQAVSDGVGAMYAYTQADRDRIVRPTAPDYLATYAETQFLLAEAAERGWITGDGVDYFEEGIRAHMEWMGVHHPDMAIPQNEIDDYVAAQISEYNMSGNVYEHIHTQYWIASFIFLRRQGFANWRRTGYPQLDPNPYPNQDISGDFIRRRTYVEREMSVNSEKVQSAISNQGWSGNNYDERVWWDTESYNP